MHRVTILPNKNNLFRSFMMLSVSSINSTETFFHFHARRIAAMPYERRHTEGIGSTRRKISQKILAVVGMARYGCL